VHRYVRWHRPQFGMCGKPASTPGERRAAGNPIRTVQGGAAGERGSGVGRLRAGRHVGAQGLPPARSVVRRRPNSASWYSGLAAAATCTVLRVIFCPVGVLRCLACGSTGCGWCATGREPCHDRTAAAFPAQPRQLDAGMFQAEISSFALRLAAEGKAAKTIRTYTEAVQWFAACLL
jgi:hypothetical protein